MECEARIHAENGQALTYAIRWQSSPELTRLEVRQADTVVKTLDISEEGITVADPIRNTQIRVENLGQVKDPLFRPVMDLLSRDILTEKLNRRWKFRGHELRGEREETFRFADPEQGTLIDMSIDLNSNLPVTMQTYQPGSGDGSSERRPVLSVRFLWSRQGRQQEMTFPIAKTRRLGRAAGPGA